MNRIHPVFAFFNSGLLSLLKDNKKRYIVMLMVTCLFFCYCKNERPEDSVFQLLSKEASGIDFVNKIVETDSFNMYAFMNIYTGGGVAVGDINNDGLEDIFFGGNRVSSKLYLNEGNLKFQDITLPAGVTTDRWCSGIAMVDLNADGWLDIYVSVTGAGTDEQRSNLFFENQKDNTFIEKAKDYGLNDSRQIMHTSFFDYDKDGDLDAYMIVNPVDFTLSNVNTVRPRQVNGESESTDRLYRNDGQTFTDVSAQAGILVEGYSLGVATCDMNGDDWPDIYVSNDFLTGDIFYINNQDGTFTDQADSLLNHTSFAGMGNDVADVNNDGLPDIVVVDMLPEDNYRRQTIIPASSYDKFQLTQQMGYLPQYTRNTLQLNNGDGSYSEISQLAGIDKTDWSWSSLLADFDNDGDRDLFITNGFLRDVGNLDYIKYQRENNTSPFGKKGEQHQQRLEAIQALGAAKIPNYVFENLGELKFKDKTSQWGIPQKTCSNGAAFADLDQDGDLEMIINNVNDRAFIYENKTQPSKGHHFIKINLKGTNKNPLGIGTKITLLTKKGKQYYQHQPYRGYASTVSQTIHFGLGNQSMIDTLLIQWPDGKQEKRYSVKADQTLSLDYQQAKTPTKTTTLPKSTPMFTSVEKERGLDFTHKEDIFIDFKIQPLLPHQHSRLGPGIATGDVNGDQLEDFYIGGAANAAGQLFLQKNDGTFYRSDQEFDKEQEDLGSLFFDAEGDGDLDLYLVSGGTHAMRQPTLYQDRLYINDGQGNFSIHKNALPQIKASGGNVTASDYDQDGDLDLFVGGRIVPGEYPMAPRSYLLQNDSRNGVPKFTDVGINQLPEQGKPGMVTTGLWSDYDQDGWTDLILVGEWMPITILQNKSGVLDATNPIELPQTNGWWNHIIEGDFDKDGDTDYIAGNLGWNARYQASPEYPVCVYANDYDKNGRIDPVICQYIGEKNYIAHPRDLLIQQINAVRARFRSYDEYGKTTFDKSFTKEELSSATVLKSNNFASSYFENKGNGLFKQRDLPVALQTAPLNSMITSDFDEDGNLDVMVVGNSFSAEVASGQYDAFKGAILRGDGKGNFEFLPPATTGFFVDTDAKTIVKLQTANQKSLFIIANNNGPLRAFSNYNIPSIVKEN